MKKRIGNHAAVIGPPEEIPRSNQVPGFTMKLVFGGESVQVWALPDGRILFVENPNDWVKIADSLGESIQLVAVPSPTGTYFYFKINTLSDEGGGLKE